MESEGKNFGGSWEDGKIMISIPIMIPIIFVTAIPNVAHVAYHKFSMNKIAKMASPTAGLLRMVT